MAIKNNEVITKHLVSKKFAATFIKPALVLIALIVGVFVIGLLTAHAQHGPMSSVTTEYFNMVYTGNLTGAQALFDANPDDMGTQMLKDQFKDRFIDQTSSLDFSRLESPKVREIAELFQAYWRDGLMQTASLEDLNASLKGNLDRILMSEGIESDLDDDDELWENIEGFIEAEGYFALSGRTPPLYELAIWMDNDTRVEEIELTDGAVKVPLTAISDFVSYGWINFSAYGMTSMGGWAEKEGLYCLCDHYDKDGEQYKLSFLKHEGRHFADFKLYPKLKAPDLEYRAKLTELAYADTSTYHLMAQFTNASNKIDNAPHPLANWYVIDGLSKALLGGQRPTEGSAWENIPAEDIRSSALLLLTEHDALLQQLGANTTKGTILVN